MIYLVEIVIFHSKLCMGICNHQQWWLNGSFTVVYRWLYHILGYFGNIMGIWWHYHSNQQANFGTWNPCLVVHPTSWLKNWIYSGIYNKHEDILQYGDWLKLLRGMSTHNSWLFWWEQKGIRANNTKLWWNMVDCVGFLDLLGKTGGF